MPTVQKVEPHPILKIGKGDKNGRPEICRIYLGVGN